MFTRTLLTIGLVIAFGALPAWPRRHLQAAARGCATLRR
jgi:hypothetical protein